MKNRTFKNIKSLGAVCGAVCLLLSSGCGTSANLSGLSASVNVAQKGTIVGLTVAGGTNSTTIGATYSSGTNNIGGSVTIP